MLTAWSPGTPTAPVAGVVEATVSGATTVVPVVLGPPLPVEAAGVAPSCRPIRKAPTPTAMSTTATPTHSHTRPCLFGGGFKMVYSTMTPVPERRAAPGRLLVDRG